MRVYACRVRSLEVVAGQACLPFSLHVRLVHGRVLVSVVALAPSCWRAILCTDNESWFVSSCETKPHVVCWMLIGVVCICGSLRLCLCRASASRVLQECVDNVERAIFSFDIASYNNRIDFSLFFSLLHFHATVWTGSWKHCSSHVSPFPQPRTSTHPHALLIMSCSVPHRL